MKFSSLSEAILYYSGAKSVGVDYPPYGSLAAQVEQVPLNPNYVTPPPPGVITYGRTLWGQSKIIEISKPSI